METFVNGESAMASGKTADRAVRRSGHWEAGSVVPPIWPIPDGRIGAIDSLRAFAMTAVVAQHCGLLPFGWTGVWLFFVISGYVVTLTATTAGAERGRRGLARFYARRSARILPVYFGYLGIGLVVVVLAGHAVDPLTALSLFAFVNNVAMIAGRGEIAGWPTGHLWTISVEMQFYLLYGLGLFWGARRVLLGALALALTVTPLLRAAAAAWLSARGWVAGDAAYAIYAGPLLHQDAFAAGALLAFASRAGLLERLARPLALLGVAALAAYALTYVWVNHALLGARGICVLRNVVSGILFGQGREVFLYSALNAAAAGLVALAATRDRLVDGLLRPAVLQRIGAISYGAYVWHALAITLAGMALAEAPGLAGTQGSLAFRLALFTFSYALTIAVAELSFRKLERWFGAGCRYSPPRRTSAPDHESTPCRPAAQEAPRLPG